MSSELHRTARRNGTTRSLFYTRHKKDRVEFQSGHKSQSIIKIKRQVNEVASEYEHTDEQNRRVHVKVLCDLKDVKVKI